jgi:hypothetical protein
VTPHPSERDLAAYAQAALPPDALLMVDDHLAVCDRCRTHAAVLADSAGRLRAATDTIHRDLVEPPLPAVDRPRTNISWAAGLAAAAAAAAVAVALNVTWGTRAVAPDMAPAGDSGRVRAPEARLTADEQAIVDRAVATGEMPRSALADSLKLKTGALMGAEPSHVDFLPLGPVGLTDTDRPTLTWTALDTRGRAVVYRVDVFDAIYDRVDRSEWLSGTAWTPERPLPGGRTYVWQVTARTGGRDVTVPAPPQPEARFMITTAEQHDGLTAMRRRADGSHLALAVLLANAGVVDEAARELALAREANPESSAVQRLQDSLKR